MKSIDKFVNRPVSADEPPVYNIILQLMRLRNEHGYSQNQLAAASRVSHTTIARIENFQMQPTLKVLLQILSVYNMTLTIIPDKKSTNVAALEEDFTCSEKQLTDSSHNTHSIEISVLKEILAKISDISLLSEKNIDYSIFIQNVLSEYCDILIEYEINPEIVETVSRLSKYLQLILAEYCSGQHDLAYTLFRECIRSCIDLDIFLKELPTDMLLYRCRRKNPEYSYTTLDMFHIPFSKRYSTSTQRYSYPGLPCLYLGASPDVCSMELSCPKEELTLATVKYHRISSKSRYLIIDLTSIFEKSEAEVSSDYSPERMLKNLPLALICSTSIDYGNVKSCEIGFKQEYIFPQLLLEYILNETLLNNDLILGIKYFSSRINFLKSWLTDDTTTLTNMCNYVFPARDVTGKSDYCSILKGCFKVDTIVEKFQTT